MDEVIIEKQEYLLFDKYKLNTNRNITRYEYISNVPLKVSKREPDMRVCKCGAHLITLAYIFDNNIFRSRTLLGRKCPCCGHNYFTLKTIALCEEAFTIVEYTDLEENIGKEVQVDMYDEMWNLNPTTKSINSSKSNNLPDWDTYFKKLAQQEYHSYQLMWKNDIVHKEFEKCAKEHINSDDIRYRVYRRGLEYPVFAEELKSIILPVYQSAQNCGFGRWKY